MNLKNLRFFYYLLMYSFFFDFIDSNIINFESFHSLHLLNRNNILNILQYNNNNNQINNKQKKKLGIRFLNESLIKCKSYDEISSRNLLCIECNIDKGYYPITFNYDKNKELEKYIKYKDCHNEYSKPINYYFNSELRVFEKCYESCLTCFGHGDQTDNNCSSCKFNYIFMPEYNYTKNCVIKCPYYYYYSLTGEYLCTENYICPEKSSFVIEDKIKCIYDCKLDDNYIYHYNSECLKNCPENTQVNDENKCLDKNIEKCTLTIKYTKLIGILLKYNNINEMAKRFAEEFLYTNNHVSQFIFDNYLILLYKNKTCLTEMNINSSIVDCEDCLTKIKEYYNISSPLIAIIDRMGKYNNPSTLYSFFNPITGEKIDTSFCEGTFIYVKKKISSLYKKEEYEWLINNNIDIYNINSSFFISPCFPFKSNFNRDLTLKDRILLFYPNISLCEEGCEYQETNYKTLITNCKCNFNETNYYLINTNLLEDELFKLKLDTSIIIFLQMVEFSEDTKIPFLICFKNLFTFKYFIKNIGGFIILILLIIQIICIILLIKNNSIMKINKFIFMITNLYIEYRKKKYKLKLNKKIQKKNNNIINEEKKMEKKLKTSSFENNNKIKNKKNEKIKTIITKEKIENNLSSNDNSRNLVEKVELNEDKKQNHKERRSSIIDINNHNFIIKLNNNYSFKEKDMKEYLSLSPDEMDFYKVLKKDKRTFCVFLINNIVKKQMIVETFFIVEETIPIYLKIILLTLYLDLYFLGVALFFTPTDISMYYHLNKKDYLKFHFKYFTYRIAISLTITTIIRYLMELFFANKASIKSIIKREKENEKELKSEMNKLIKSIKIRYIIFIILNIIFKIFSWYYISSFNNAYPNTKYFWIILSLVTILVAQIISICFAFLEACLRFIAIKLKISGLFTLSKYINSL